MAEDTDLEAFLQTQRANSQCWCENAPPEVVAQIDAAANGGSRQWAAMRRWLEANGIVVKEGRFDGHFSKRHHIKDET